MKKLLKTMLLLPVFPLIWLSGARSPYEPLYEWERGTCYGRGLAMLKWRVR